MSKTGTTEKPDPWRVPVAVAQIPETGLHRDIEADQAIRNAVADVGGLREVLSVQASFDVTPARGGRFHVAGHLRARIGQTCVVTLEEMETDIDEPIDLTFAPPEQIPQMAALVDEAGESDEVTPDPARADREWNDRSRPGRHRRIVSRGRSISAQTRRRIRAGG